MSSIVDQIGKSMKEDLTRDPRGDDPDPIRGPEDESFLVAGAPSPVPTEEEAEDIEMEPPFVSAARGADEPAPASASAAAAAEPEPTERRGVRQPSKRYKSFQDPRFRKSWRYVQTTVSKADTQGFTLPYLKSQLEVGTDLPLRLNPPETGDWATALPQRVPPLRPLPLLPFAARAVMSVPFAARTLS